MRLQVEHKRPATYLAFALIPLSGLITDMYLPSMPQMATYFSQSEKNIQLTLTFFLISYGISQFITGTIMDSFGRRNFILVSLLVFSASCIIIAASDSLSLIYAMRILQGITTGFIVVAKRAFFVDVYRGEQRQRYLMAIVIVWSFAPIIAPFVGGYLQYYFNWKAVFYILAGYGFLMLILEYIFTGETLVNARHFSFANIQADYKQILSDRAFTAMLLMFGLCYSGAMVFSLSAPFIIEHVLHYSSVITGYASLLSGLGWLLGGLLNKRFRQQSLYLKVKTASLVQVAITISMIASSAFVWNIYSCIAFSFLMIVASSFIYNNVFTFCIGRFPQLAGVVSGVCGGSNFIVTSASSYGIVWLLKPLSQWELGWGYFILSIKKNPVVNPINSDT
jgi:MFS transporter, DHA1 family, multidrug resistance protein